MSGDVVKLRVRYGEVDKMAVVYHPNHLKYFEIGRTEYMRARGVTYARLEDSGYKFVVSEAHCKYMGGARYDDEIEINTQLAEAGNTSVKFQYLITKGGEKIATGYVILAYVNNEGKLCRMPADLIGKLKGEKSISGAKHVH